MIPLSPGPRPHLRVLVVALYTQGATPPESWPRPALLTSPRTRKAAEGRSSQFWHEPRSSLTDGRLWVPWRHLRSPWSQAPLPRVLRAAATWRPGGHSPTVMQLGLEGLTSGWLLLSPAARPPFPGSRSREKAPWAVLWAAGGGRSSLPRLSPRRVLVPPGMRGGEASRFLSIPKEASPRSLAGGPGPDPLHPGGLRLRAPPGQSKDGAQRQAARNQPPRLTSLPPTALV